MRTKAKRTRKAWLHQSALELSKVNDRGFVCLEPLTTLQESSAKLPCRHEGLEEKVVNLQIPALYGVQSSAKLPLRHERLGANLVDLHLSAPSSIP